MQKNIVPAVIIAALVISSCNNKEGEMTKTDYKWADSVLHRLQKKRLKN